MELPQGKKVLIFVFNLVKPTQEGIEETQPLLHLVFYCIDKEGSYIPPPCPAILLSCWTKTVSPLTKGLSEGQKYS